MRLIAKSKSKRHTHTLVIVSVTSHGCHHRAPWRSLPRARLGLSARVVQTLFFSRRPAAGHRRVVVTFCFEIKHTHNSFGLAVLTHNFNLLLVLDLTLHAALALLQLHLHLGLLAQQHRPMAHPAIEARIPGLEGHPPPEELDPPGDPPPKPMLNPTLPEDLLLRGQKGERGQKRDGQRGDLRSPGRLTFSRWLSAQMTALQSHLSRQCGSNRAH